MPACIHLYFNHTASAEWRRERAFMYTLALKVLRSTVVKTESYRQLSVLPYPSRTQAELTLLSHDLIVRRCYRIFFFTVWNQDWGGHSVAKCCNVNWFWWETLSLKVTKVSCKGMCFWGQGNEDSPPKDLPCSCSTIILGWSYVTWERGCTGENSRGLVFGNQWWAALISDRTNLAGSVSKEVMDEI